jgi:hypothetical protein
MNWSSPSGQDSRESHFATSVRPIGQSWKPTARHAKFLQIPRRRQWLRYADAAVYRFLVSGDKVLIHPEKEIRTQIRQVLCLAVTDRKIGKRKDIT